MGKRNLLEETITFLKKNGKTEEDVKWVVNEERRFTWLRFSTLADKMYDAGWGSTEVNRNLVIIGDGWWLERNGYDGAEWWEFKSLPDASSFNLASPNLDDIFTYSWLDDRKREAEEAAKKEAEEMEDARLAALDPGDTM